MQVDMAMLASLPTAAETAIPNFPQITPDDLAYVLFTSGTTGKPKAIEVEHGSLYTSAGSHGSKWRIGPGTRVLQFAAYSFGMVFHFVCVHFLEC
jgi:acyl-coenzyme A synthetase/AMP-(fatty) acid ligase